MKEIRTPLEAYFLGWMYSDGCVYYNKKAYSYSTRLKLKADPSEEKVLDLFMELAPFKKYYELKGPHNAVAIMTYNREFALDLIKLGVLQDKSNTQKELLTLPSLDKELMKYFIRGLFDGDGSYHLLKPSCLAISVYMDNIKFLGELSDWFKNNLDIICHTRKQASYSKAYRLRISLQKDVKKYIDFVFDTTSDLSLVLDRKYDIINSYIYEDISDIRKRIGKTMKGIKKSPMTEEHRKNLSASKLGVKRTEEQKAKVKKQLRENYTQKIEVWSNSLLLGVYNSAAEIEETSLLGTFKDYIKTVNPNGRNGYPFYYLADKNVNVSSNTNIPYKGLTFKKHNNQDNPGQIKLDELLETPKALDTRNSENSKDKTMDNQQPSSE